MPFEICKLLRPTVAYLSTCLTGSPTRKPRVDWTTIFGHRPTCELGNSYVCVRSRSPQPRPQPREVCIDRDNVSPLSSTLSHSVTHWPFPASFVVARVPRRVCVYAPCARKKSSSLLIHSSCFTSPFIEPFDMVLSRFEPGHIRPQPAVFIVRCLRA